MSLKIPGVHVKQQGSTAHKVLSLLSNIQEIVIEPVGQIRRALKDIYRCRLIGAAKKELDELIFEKDRQNYTIAVNRNNGTNVFVLKSDAKKFGMLELRCKGETLGGVCYNHIYFFHTKDTMVLKETSELPNYNFVIQEVMRNKAQKAHGNFDAASDVKELKVTIVDPQSDTLTNTLILTMSFNAAIRHCQFDSYLPHINEFEYTAPSPDQSNGSETSSVASSYDTAASFLSLLPGLTSPSTIGTTSSTLAALSNITDVWFKKVAHIGMVDYYVLANSSDNEPQYILENNLKVDATTMKVKDIQMQRILFYTNQLAAFSKENCNVSDDKGSLIGYLDGNDMFEADDSPLYKVANKSKREFIVYRADDKYQRPVALITSDKTQEFVRMEIVESLQKVSSAAIILSLAMALSIHTYKLEKIKGSKIQNVSQLHSLIASVVKEVKPIAGQTRKKQ